MPRLPSSALLALAIALSLARPHRLAAADPAPLNIVVMDPLSKRLACACVKGFAQRDYAALGTYLEEQLKRPVKIIEGESLPKALLKADVASVALIIGKDSLARQQATEAGLKPRPLCALTGKDGKTTLTGFFVVRERDSARRLADLKGQRRTFFFGPEAEVEKYGAALDALRAAGVATPAKPQVRESCNAAVLDLVESKLKPAPVAVVSSYALPLVEGCGVAEKGSLRILAETKPVPFITVFATAALGAKEADAVLRALLAVKQDKELPELLETKDGFVPLAKPEDPKSAPKTSLDWPQWRGPTRDGHVPQLPDTLPATPRVVWRKPLAGPGHAGVVVAQGRVIVCDRLADDTEDAWLCLDAEDGAERWRLAYPARGQMDYGVSPRAAPLVQDGLVFLLGALGDLHCVALDSGKVVWKKDLSATYAVKAPKWGYSSSPLIAEGRLIVNPGAPAAALVALEPRSGREVWRSPGEPAAYASLLLAEIRGRKELIGYTANAATGWNLATGQRIWALRPEQSGDFNVPSPLVYEDHLVLATENNGVRLHVLDPTGVPARTPAATSMELAPDTSSPVRVGNLLIGCARGLFCLDLGQGLKQVFHSDDDLFQGHAALLADAERVLVLGQQGGLALLRVNPAGCQIIARSAPLAEEREVYSHPALVGSRLFVRDNVEIACVDLGQSPPR